MTYGIRTRKFRSGFWCALVAALIGVVVLGIIEEHVSTGWRMFMLARGLRSVWAATAAMIVGIGAWFTLDALAPAGDRRTPALGLVAGALKVVIVMISASGTLGYFMPDWTPLSTGLAALVLIIWMVAGAASLASG